MMKSSFMLYILCMKISDPRESLLLRRAEVEGSLPNSPSLHPTLSFSFSLSLSLTLVTRCELYILYGYR